MLHRRVQRLEHHPNTKQSNYLIRNLGPDHYWYVAVKTSVSSGLEGVSCALCA